MDTTISPPVAALSDPDEVQRLRAENEAFRAEKAANLKAMEKQLAARAAEAAEESLVRERYEKAGGSLTREQCVAVVRRQRNHDAARAMRYAATGRTPPMSRGGKTAAATYAEKLIQFEKIYGSTEMAHTMIAVQFPELVRTIVLERQMAARKSILEKATTIRDSGGLSWREAIATVCATERELAAQSNLLSPPQIEQMADELDAMNLRSGIEQLATETNGGRLRDGIAKLFGRVKDSPQYIAPAKA